VRDAAAETAHALRPGVAVVLLVPDSGARVDADADAHTVADTGAVKEGETEGERVCVGDTVPDAHCDGETVLQPLKERDGEDVGHTVNVGEGEAVGEMVTVPDVTGDALSVGVSVPETVDDAEKDGETDTDGELDINGLTEGEPDILGLPDWDIVTLTVADGRGDDVPELDGDAAAVKVMEYDDDTDSLNAAVTVSDAVESPVARVEALAGADAEADGVPRALKDPASEAEVVRVVFAVMLGHDGEGVPEARGDVDAHALPVRVTVVVTDLLKETLLHADSVLRADADDVKGCDAGVADTVVVVVKLTVTRVRDAAADRAADGVVVSDRESVGEGEIERLADMVTVDVPLGVDEPDADSVTADEVGDTDGLPDGDAEADALPLSVTVAGKVGANASGTFMP
jgi:hypothetical protein